MSVTEVVKPGHNCWRVERAHRVGFVVDAGPYYGVLADALARAERQVWIVGWDLDSRVRLTRCPSPRSDDESDDLRLRSVLNHLVQNRRDLKVYLLCWDYALIYALEREWLPLYSLGWRTHRRVRFELDDRHPPGACHHQKIVVIDDDVAFCGGIDLTQRRWDTPRHAVRDPRRRDTRGGTYSSFHDVQVALQGPAAQALGDLCRWRWQQAIGKRVQPVDLGRHPHDCWPPSLHADLFEVDVAIARTLPAFRRREEVAEIRRLYCDLIAASRRYVYLEHQYLTAAAIRDALVRRLQHAEGPEIVVVGPLSASGWLESNTMDVMRMRVVGALRRADKWDRLHLYYPCRSTEAGQQMPVYVHSKVMIADDRWLRVGSANLSNRSMAVDSECDVLFDAGEDETTIEVVKGFRNRLLAEHLGRTVDDVARSVEASGSISRAVQALTSGGTATLEPLPVAAQDKWLEPLLSENPPFDPLEPMEPAEMFDELVPEDMQRQAGRPILRGAIVLAALLGCAAMWRWTPLGDWLDPRTLAVQVAPLQHSGWGPLLTIAAYFLAAATLFPVTVLIVETAAVFGPWLGGLYSLLGILTSAALTFGAGLLLGRRVVRRMAGSRLNKVSRRLAQGGAVGVTLVRLLPIAPYTIVNLVAGASHLRFRDFMLGTTLGMAPGLVALTALGHQLMATLTQPNVERIAVLALAALGILLAGVLLSRWLRRRHT